MKSLLICITLCILHFSVTIAQTSHLQTFESYSQDKNYKLTYTSHYPDPPLTENMIDDFGNVIWEKKIPFEGNIVVSNLGDFIIYHQNQFTIFDQAANVKATLKTDTQSEEYLIDYAGCELENNYQFSIDGEAIYGILENRKFNVLTLVAISNIGEEKWRKPLDDLFTSKRPKLTPLQNGILLHNYSSAGRYLNICFYINGKGNILNKYQDDFRRPHPPYISFGDTTEVILYNRDSLNVYSQQTGQLIRNLNDEELIAKLYENNQEEIHFTLSIIIDKKERDYLVLRHLEKFRQLALHENKNISKLSNYLLRTLYQHQ